FSQEISNDSRASYSEIEISGNARPGPLLPGEHGFNGPTRIAPGARDLSRRNVSTAQMRQQNSKAFFAHQHPCGLKSALRRSRGDRAKHILAESAKHFLPCFPAARTGAMTALLYGLLAALATPITPHAMRAPALP